MRKASFVLGIIGGCLAILVAVLFIFFSIAANFAFNVLDDTMVDMDDIVIDIGDDQFSIDSEHWDIDIDGDDIRIDSGMARMPFRAFGRFTGALLWLPAVLCFISAVLAFIGVGVLKKNNVTAGVLMIVAAVPCLLTGIGFLAFLLLILGGIFALVRDTSAQATVPPANPPAINA